MLLNFDFEIHCMKIATFLGTFLFAYLDIFFNYMYFFANTEALQVCIMSLFRKLMQAQYL
jgi:uncharacterized membrane protein YjjP (DUF1212 family)